MTVRSDILVLTFLWRVFYHNSFEKSRQMNVARELTDFSNFCLVRGLKKFVKSKRDTIKNVIDGDKNRQVGNDADIWRKIFNNHLSKM